MEKVVLRNCCSCDAINFCSGQTFTIFWMLTCIFYLLCFFLFRQDFLVWRHTIRISFLFFSFWSIFSAISLAIYSLIFRWRHYCRIVTIFLWIIGNFLKYFYMCFAGVPLVWVKGRVCGNVLITAASTSRPAIIALLLFLF